MCQSRTTEVIAIIVTIIVGTFENYVRASEIDKLQGVIEAIQNSFVDVNNLVIRSEWEFWQHGKAQSGQTQTLYRDDHGNLRLDITDIRKRLSNSSSDLTNLGETKRIICDGGAVYITRHVPDRTRYGRPLASKSDELILASETPGYNPSLILDASRMSQTLKTELKDPLKFISGSALSLLRKTDRKQGVKLVEPDSDSSMRRIEFYWNDPRTTHITS